MDRSRVAASLVLLATPVLGVGLVPAPALAASPNPAASCVAQLNQAATPHGLFRAPPGTVGRYTSGLATSGPGLQGAGTSAAAQQHGVFWDCVPAG
jgi:hypothetical protein